MSEKSSRRLICARCSSVCTSASSACASRAIQPGWPCLYSLLFIEIWKGLMPLMKLHVCLILAMLIAAGSDSQAQQAPPYPAPDDRYKPAIPEENSHPAHNNQFAACIAKPLQQ